MSNEGKKPDGSEHGDDWVAAVEEWDLTLDFPAEGAKSSQAVNASPAAAASTAASADFSDDKTPVPGLGADFSDEKTPVPGEDPGAAPTHDVADTTNLTGPAVVAALPAFDEPSPDDDPLRGLLDDELDLPAAPKALGSLLGDRPTAPPPAYADDDEDLSIEFGPDEPDATASPAAGPFAGPDERTLALTLGALESSFPEDFEVFEQPPAAKPTQPRTPTPFARPAPTTRQAPTTAKVDVVVGPTAGKSPTANVQIVAGNAAAGAHSPDAARPPAAGAAAAPPSTSAVERGAPVEAPRPAPTPAAPRRGANPEVIARLKEALAALDDEAPAASSPAPRAPLPAPPPPVEDADFYDDISIETSSTVTEEAPPSPIESPAAAVSTGVTAPAAVATGSAAPAAIGIESAAPAAETRRIVVETAPALDLDLDLGLDDPRTVAATPPAALVEDLAFAAAATSAGGAELSVAAAGPTSESLPATAGAEPPPDGALDVFDFPVDLEAPLAAADASEDHAIASSPRSATTLLDMPAPTATRSPTGPVARTRRLVDQPAPVSRLATAVPAPSVVVQDATATPLFDAAESAATIALLDGERALAQDPARVADLAVAAARLAERSGDPQGARARYEMALEAVPGHVPSLRGLRRLAIGRQRPDEAADLLEQEIERSAPGERIGLLALRADLLFAAGAWEAARGLYRAVVQEVPGDLRARLGLVDAALASGDAEGFHGELAALAGMVRDRRVESALRAELARIAEAAGDDERAVATFRESLAADDGALAPALGLLRLAVRSGSTDDQIRAHLRIADRLGGAVKTAILRRVAALDLAAGDAAAAADALGNLTDIPSLSLRAAAEEAAGRTGAAAATLEQLAVLEDDALRRAEALLRLGELHERQGGIIDAAHAYERAAQAAPIDLRAARAVERISRARGDVEKLVEVAHAEGARHPASADASHLRAARLLVELGRPADAVAELERVLAKNPRHTIARAEFVEVHLRANQPSEAARVLARAADAEEDADVAMLLRERATRLFARGGETQAALTLVARLRDGNLGPAASWLEQRLLAPLSSNPERDRAIAAAYRAEAESTTDAARAASLWHWCGLALAPWDPEASVESLRRALELSPAHCGAVVALERRAADAKETTELIALEHVRVAAVEGRAESVVARMRLAALEDHAGDPAGAVRGYVELLGLLLPGNPAVRLVEDLLADAARRAGDHARVAEVRARLWDQYPDATPTWRGAEAIWLAELNEHRLAQLETASSLYTRALELRPSSPLALPGLSRTYKALGKFSELAALHRAELDAEETDLPRKIEALERLAALEAERGDMAASRQYLEDILAMDHAHHGAFRALERDALREERWADLVALYQQMGLTAADASYAVAIYLDLARLRERLGGADRSEIDNHLRMALYRDAGCRPALRRILASARDARDFAQLAELQARLADGEPNPRAAAVFATRAGEALEALGQREAATARYRAAADGARHLVALRSLGKLALAAGAHEDVVWASATAGQVLRDPAERARAHLVAGVIAEERLKDVPRALESYRAVLVAEPHNRDAFDRVRALLDGQKSWESLAASLESRIAVETEAPRLVTLLTETATLYRDRLGNRDLAKRHLRRVLQLEPTHAGALLALSDLHYADAEWPEAAEVLIRRARIEKDTAILKDIFFKLGLIYDERIPDTKRAVVSFTRVLQYDPENRTALEHLSNLHLKAEEWKGALGATARLAELEPDPVRKVAHLHRVAKIHEDGLKDMRLAHDAYRRATDVDPGYLPAMGELVKFYERSGDMTSARVNLDRSAQSMRAQLARDPNNPAPYHSLFHIFQWRRSFDQAVTVAQLLKSMGQLDADEKTLLDRFGEKGALAGSALGDPTLDEQLFVSAVPPGFRHMFRLLDESLQKHYRTDLKRLGVGRGDKLPRSGHAVRDVVQRVMTDLGIRDLDVYVTSAQTKLLTVELTDPLSLVMSADLVEGASEAELLFFAGRCLKMVHSKMAVPMRLTGDELGILLGGIVRQFVPDFVPRGFEEGPIAAEAARLSRVIPKRLHQELLPFALECADPSVDLRALATALVHTANRGGALCASSLPASLSALRRLGDEAQVRDLQRFAISDELADLRRAVGIAIG